MGRTLNWLIAVSEAQVRAERVHHVHPAICRGQVGGNHRARRPLAETQNRVGGLEESVAMLDVEAAGRCGP